MDEITKHKEYKQLALYSYDVNNDNNLPPGYKVLGISSMDDGFYAVVARKCNEIVIAYRGTEGCSLMNKEARKDLGNDLAMFTRLLTPSQAEHALNLYDQIKREYPECEVNTTGHSLGASLAQIVAALRNTSAVTFNAFGTGDILRKKYNVTGNFSDKITNYCNPDDIITTVNATNHVGKCYALCSDKNSNFGPHYLESFEPIENRVRTSGEDLDWHYKMKQKAQKQWNELEYYINTGKHKPVTMPSMGFNNNCAGTYSVSEYTKKDGTHVSAYSRTCGAKHLK